MGVSYREFLRSQAKTRKNPRISRTSEGETTAERAALWAKYARVARYRHHKKDSARKASERLM